MHPATWFVLSRATVRVLKFRSVDDNIMILNDLIPRDEVDEGSLIKKSTGSTSGAEKGETTNVICLRLCAVQEKVIVYSGENITWHGISRRVLVITATHGSC